METATIVHKSETRKAEDFGFMQAQLSFRPHLQEDRRQFGALVAIDDAIVAPGSKGFGFHPHEDLEVITLLTEGSVYHQDANVPAHNAVLEAKSCQLITSGTGIVHNETNHSDSEPFRALQIWILPREKGLVPGYDNRRLSPADHADRLQLIISPDGRDNSLVIQQDAFVYFAMLSAGQQIEYEKLLNTNGLYLYIYEGSIEISESCLEKGDGIGLIGHPNVHFTAKTDSHVLLFDAPMES